MDPVATLLAAAAFVTALLLYLKPPPWIKKSLKEIGSNLNGQAMGEAAKTFFSGWVGHDDDGNPIELRMEEAATLFASQIAAASTERILEEAPIILATMRKHSLAKEMQEKSAWARGASKLSSGGFGELGAVADMGKSLFAQIGTGGKGKGGMGEIMQWAQYLPMLQQLGGGGNQPDNGPAALPQPQTGNYHSGGKLGGG